MWLMALVASAHAQVVVYDLTSTFSLVGSASVGVDRIEIVPPRSDQVGAAWVGSFELPDGGGFRATFEVALDRALNTGGGGLVFTLQGEGALALGGGDEGMGYEGITPSLGVELDIWLSYGTNDPDGNHLGINLDGSLSSSTLFPVVFLIDDVPSVFGRVDYTLGQVHVWLDVAPIPEGTAPALSYTWSGLSGPLWVGFTASSGDELTARSVRAFSFVADGDLDGDGTMDFEDPDVIDTGSDDTSETGGDTGSDTGDGGGSSDDETLDSAPEQSRDTADPELDLPRVFFCGCSAKPSAPGLVELGFLGLLWRRRRAA